MRFNSPLIERRAFIDTAGAQYEEENRERNTRINLLVMIFASLWKYSNGMKHDESVTRAIDSILTFNSDIHALIARLVDDDGPTYNSNFFDTATRKVTGGLEHISDAEIAKFFSHTVTVLWKEQKKSARVRTVLAKLLAMNGRFVEKEIDMIKNIAESDVPMEVDPWVRMTLCRETEPNYKKSKEVGNWLIVNDFMEIKFEGEIVGYCTKTTRAPNGSIFLRGVFYRPEGTTFEILRAERERGGKAGRKIKIIDAEWNVARGAWLKQK